MLAELDEIINAEIKDPKLAELVKDILGEHAKAFRESTAAIKVHHNYKYGLLEHTLHVAKNAVAMARNYPNVNASLAAAGAILHDIGKIEEYSTGLETDKTRAGNLQSHMALGYAIVRNAAIKVGVPEKLRQEIEHIILSHHGKLEYGAVVLPQTPEAMIVHAADMADAIYRNGRNLRAQFERARIQRLHSAYGCNILVDRYQAQ